MIRFVVNGIEVQCESGTDAAELIAAMGRTSTALPAPRAKKAAPVARTAPAPRAPREEPTPIKAGRQGTWTDEELKSISAQIVKGARLDVIAKNYNRSYAGLYGALRKAGLPTKFMKQEVPVRKLEPGTSGITEDNGRKRA